jgi:hypothetical protein
MVSVVWMYAALPQEHDRRHLPAPDTSGHKLLLGPDADLLVGQRGEDFYVVGE